MVKIPLTKEQATLEPEQTLLLIDQTLEDLKHYGVDIVLPPRDFPGSFPHTIRICDNKKIFPFFIMEAVEKALNVFNKDIKTAEILIVDGDKELSLILIDMIYLNVNNLSLMTSDTDDFIYECLVEDIFSECGLSLRILEKNKAALETADIIINTSSSDDRYDFYYKRGATYFELGKNRNKLLELAGKREDMLIVDDLKINCSGDLMTLDLFETIFFTGSKRYRTLSNRGYEPQISFDIKKEIDEMAVEVKHFYLAGKALTSSHFMKTILKAGGTKNGVAAK